MDTLQTTFKESHMLSHAKVVIKSCTLQIGPWGLTILLLRGQTRSLVSLEKKSYRNTGKEKILSTD